MPRKFSTLTLLALYLMSGLLAAQNGSLTARRSFPASDFDTEHCLLYYRGLWKSHQNAFQLDLGPDAKYEMKTSDAPGSMREERGTVAYEVAGHIENPPFSQAFSIIPSGAAPVRRAPNGLDYLPVEGSPVGPSMRLHLRNEASGKVRTLLVSAISYRQGVVVLPMLLMLRDLAPGSPPIVLSANPLQYFPEVHVAFSQSGVVPQVDITPAMLVGSWRGSGKRWQDAERNGVHHNLQIEEGGKSAIADMSPAEVAEQQIPECVCRKVGDLEVGAQGALIITWRYVRGHASEVVGNSTIQRLVDQLFAGSNNRDTLDSFEMKRTAFRQRRGAEISEMHRVVVMHGECESGGKPCAYESDSSLEP